MYVCRIRNQECSRCLQNVEPENRQITNHKRYNLAQENIFAPEVPSVLTKEPNPGRIKVDGAIIEAREVSGKAQSASKLPATVKVKYTDDSGKENITNINTTKDSNSERIIDKLDTAVTTRSGRESKAPERLGYAGVQLTSPGVTL